MVQVPYNNKTVNGQQCHNQFCWEEERGMLSHNSWEDRSSQVVDSGQFPSSFSMSLFCSFQTGFRRSSWMVGNVPSCPVTAEWLELDLMEILDPIFILLVHSVLAAANSCFVVVVVVCVFYCSYHFFPYCHKCSSSSWWQKLIFSCFQSFNG